MAGNIQLKLGRLSTGQPEFKPGGDRVWGRPGTYNPNNADQGAIVPSLAPHSLLPRSIDALLGRSPSSGNVTSDKIAGKRGRKEAYSQWWVGNAYE